MVRKIKAKLVLRLRADGFSSRQIEAQGIVPALGDRCHRGR